MKALLLDLLVLCSVASLAYGGWLIAPAAGFMIGGGLGLILSLGLIRGDKV